MSQEKIKSPCKEIKCENPLQTDPNLSKDLTPQLLNKAELRKIYDFHCNKLQESLLQIAQVQISQIGIELQDIIKTYQIEDLDSNIVNDLQSDLLQVAKHLILSQDLEVPNYLEGINFRQNYYHVFFNHSLPVVQNLIKFIRNTLSLNPEFFTALEIRLMVSAMMYHDYYVEIDTVNQEKTQRLNKADNESRSAKVFTNRMNEIFKSRTNSQFGNQVCTERFSQVLELCKIAIEYTKPAFNIELLTIFQPEVYGLLSLTPKFREQLFQTNNKDQYENSLIEKTGSNTQDERRLKIILDPQSVKIIVSICLSDLFTAGSEPERFSRDAFLLGQEDKRNKILDSYMSGEINLEDVVNYEEFWTALDDIVKFYEFQVNFCIGQEQLLQKYLNLLEINYNLVRFAKSIAAFYTEENYLKSLTNAKNRAEEIRSDYEKIKKLKDLNDYKNNLINDLKIFLETLGLNPLYRAKHSIINLFNNQA